MSMHEQDMHPPLNEYLQALKDHAQERDPNMAAKGRAQFLAEAETSRAPEPVPWFAGIREKFASLHIYGSRRLATAIASILLAIALTFGAVGGTVYASQDTLPNQTLYAVKTFTEDLRLRFADQPQEKLQLLEEFTGRRVEELSALAEQGEELPQGTLSRLEQHTEIMFQLAAEQEEHGVTQALHQIRNALKVHEEVIARLKDKESGNAVEALSRVQEKLRQKIQLAEDGLKNPTSFRERMKGSKPFETVETEEPGKSQDKGKPEDVGTPENKGKPEDVGTPEDKGKTEDGENPQGKGKPDHAGTPESKGNPDSARPPKDKDKDK